MMRITARALSAALLVLGLGLGAFSASAQTPPQPPQPSANALALARQLLDLKGATTVYKNAVPGIIQHVEQQLLQSNVTYQKDLDDIAGKLQQQFNGREAEMGKEMARIYATDFSEAELKDLVAFYKSALGQKLLTQEPKTIAASLQYMQSWGDKFGDEVDGKFHEEMSKRGKPIQ